MQSAIEYAAIPTINLTPLFLVTNPLTNSSQSDTLQVKSPHSCKTSPSKQNSLDIHEIRFTMCNYIGLIR